MLPKKDATNSNTKNQGRLNLLNSVDTVELSEDQMEAISGGIRKLLAHELTHVIQQKFQTKSFSPDRFPVFFDTSFQQRL